MAENGTGTVDLFSAMKGPPACMPKVRSQGANG